MFNGLEFGETDRVGLTRRVLTHAAAGLVLCMAFAGLGLVIVLGDLRLVASDDLVLDRLLVDRAFLVSRAVSALLFAASGWYLSLRRPGVVFGPLCMAAGLGSGLAVLGGQWAVLSQVEGHQLPATSLGLWFLNWGLAVEPVVLAAILLLFPDGRRPTGLVGAVGIVSLGLCMAGLVHAVVQPLPVEPTGPFGSFRHPFGLSVLPGLDDGLLFGPGLLLAAGVLIVRWLRARGEVRLVLRSLAVVTLVVAVVPLTSLAVGGLDTVVILVVVIAGVLRHRVYGIEVIVNRTLVYAVLTAVVAGVYGALVGLLALVTETTGVASGVLPAIAAAFSLFPARQRVQRLVNRFLYGQRDEPYAVVSGIASRLESAGSVEHLLPGLLESIANALRVPYAAVDLRLSDGGTRRIEQGTATSDVEAFPLIHQGRALGELVVGRRTGQTALGAGERQLLLDIARQAAVAASNVLLTQELVRSRERIISAAEEERRRLRRDLHDGLGPVLTAAATRVDAARNFLRRDLDRSDELLGEVRGDLTSALGDLRRLVYALRPPVLDELGLLGAVREHVRRSPIPVVLHLPDVLPPLPPAVEVAAYRIMTEAITNVSRHAIATSCTVSIHCDEHLEIDVCDDGASARVWTPGVGLSSMRERTTELGGQWEAGPRPQGGGRVHVELPLMLAGGK